MSVSEFPDILGWLEGHLAGVLQANGYPTVLVSQKYQAVPVPVVWLARDGGPALDVRRELARVRVNCVADQNIDAFASRVRAVMSSLAGAGPVRKVVEQSGPVDVPNVKPWRYMLYELTVVGSPLTLV